MKHLTPHNGPSTLRLTNQHKTSNKPKPKHRIDSELSTSALKFMGKRRRYYNTPALAFPPQLATTKVTSTDIVGTVCGLVLKGFVYTATKCCSDLKKKKQVRTYTSLGDDKRSLSNIELLSIEQLTEHLLGVCVSDDMSLPNRMQKE
ncbi:hypothetical protein CHS0354_007198 [Potamilus streckersoni]|uniref:Uncharacterized protein n=1 Tax=Potamilus streckersoni TaxID=2493646 RepID=A0AAE0T6B7_9BIVA|nr:hypothetical protein CHS0354_007198 [Potamilus streckersoni]